MSRTSPGPRWPSDDGPAAAGPAAGGRPAGRGRPRAGARPGQPLTAQLPYAIVLAGVLGGVAWILLGSQSARAGTLTVAAALFVAVAVRIVLPAQRAGMLASRRRFIDVTALSMLAVGLLVAGLVLPTPS